MAAARDHFSSRLGVLAATLGSAVGLGNIWKFPALVGQNGGASFLLVYILATLCIGLPLMIACLVGSIGGLILMSVGRSRASLALGVSGFALFTLTFGFTTSIALSAYSMESVANALLATAGIMAVFGALGMAFPSFFARIQGVLAVSLLAVIVVELVMMALGVRQNLTDLVVILLFCGFIGYDVYRASTDAPTLENALWYAIEIYLDVVNVMLRLLSIFGNRD